jgi:hypothetical protein
LSHFSLTRPSWVSGTALYAFELAAIDAKTFKAINGDEGGTWAPSSVITVGGSGMTVKLVGINTVDAASELRVSGSLTVQNTGGFESFGYANFYGPNSFGFSAVFFGGTVTLDTGSFLNVNGTTTFTGTVNAAFIGVQNVQVSNSLTTAADSVCNVGGHLAVSQSAAFYDTVAHNSTTSLVGATTANAVTANGLLTVNGSATLASVASCTGIGRVRRRAVYTLHSGFGVMSPDVATTWLGENLTGELTLQLPDPTLFPDDELYICNRSATYGITIQDETGSLLIRLLNISGTTDSIRYQSLGGSWYQIARTKV